MFSTDIAYNIYRKRIYSQARHIMFYNTDVFNLNLNPENCAASTRAALSLIN